MGAGKPAPTLYSFAPLTHIIFRSQSSLQMLRSLRIATGAKPLKGSVATVLIGGVLRTLTTN